MFPYIKKYLSSSSLCSPASLLFSQIASPRSRSLSVFRISSGIPSSGVGRKAGDSRWPSESCSRELASGEARVCIGGCADKQPGRPACVIERCPVGCERVTRNEVYVLVPAA